jgi:hypothetical protein
MKPSLMNSAVLLGALAVLTGGMARAETIREVTTATGSGVTIRLSTPLTYAPHFGFVPVRVAVENRSARDGVWTVKVTSGETASFPGRASSGARIEVAAGATKESWIYAPMPVPGIVAALVLDPKVPREPTPLYPVNPPPAPVASPTVNSAAAAAALEAAATAVLGPTKLLDTPWGVSESVTTQNGVVTFEQTGNALVMVRPPAGSLPPGVIVNLHAALDPSQVVRTITYVAPETLAAVNAPPVSRADAYRKAVSRNQLALWRYGYLRRSGVVQPSLATSFADRDGVVTTSVTETGPSTLLAQPLPDALPPDTLVSLAPAPVLPGGVIRKFTVTTLVTAAATDSASPGPFSAVLGSAEPGRILVEVAGPGIARPVWTDLSATLDGEIQPMPPIVIPPQIRESLLERLALGNLRGTPTVTEIDPASLPADWRLWASLHAVVLKQSDYTKLDAEHRGALRRWVALGGRLVLATDSEEDGQIERVGAGAIVPLRGSIGYLPPAEISRQLQLSAPSLSLPIGESLARDHDSIESFGAGERSDTRWLVYVLIGFAVVAGPVNLLVFAPAGRRHRTLVSMPLIALVGAVVMGAGVVARVGLGGEGVRNSVVALAPEDGGAAVFQDQVSRTGILTSHRFDLPDDTVMAAASLDAGGAQVGGAELVRENGQASGDWFRSRSFQAYQLRRFVATPGKVELTTLAADGTPTVTSSLKGTLTDFAWVDDQDRLWTAAALEPGKAATLTAAKDATWPRLQPRGSKSLREIFAAASTRQPGRWTARTGENDFAPIPTLTSIRWKDGEVLVTGLAIAKAWNQPPAETPLTP